MVLVEESSPVPTVHVTAKIINKLGLHARPAMSFVETASGYKASIMVAKGTERVDGKSIMQMMMLAATKDTMLTIEADGDDADDACAALKALIESGFDED